MRHYHHPFHGSTKETVLHCPQVLGTHVHFVSDLEEVKIHNGGTIFHAVLQILMFLNQ